MSPRASLLSLALTLLACAGPGLGAQSAYAEELERLTAEELSVRQAARAALETRFMANRRRLTFEGRRAGEGYFDPSGGEMVFQSEREPGNPWYQIYLLNMGTGDTQRISPGFGKTTCAWIAPADLGGDIYYASTHHDPKSREYQQAELDFRASGQTRRYSWDYDDQFELYRWDRATGEQHRLSTALGYDAEASVSPTGEWIVFASNRHAFLEPLSAEDQQRFDVDRSLFLDLYLARPDGSETVRLTTARGYDGGPFFSADGQHICWRRFNEKGTQAEIMTMDLATRTERKLTELGAMSWAPYFHPSGEYLIFTTNRHGFANFELYLVDAQGEREPVRVSYTAGFDGLPVFTPDGQGLAWTTNREVAEGEGAQIWLSGWNHDWARERIAKSPRRERSAEAGPTSAEIAPGAAKASAAATPIAAGPQHVGTRLTSELFGLRKAVGGADAEAPERAKGLVLRQQWIGAEFRKAGLDSLVESGAFTVPEAPKGLAAIGLLRSKDASAASQRGLPPVLLSASFSQPSSVAALLRVCAVFQDEAIAKRMRRDVLCVVWEEGEADVSEWLKNLSSGSLEGRFVAHLGLGPQGSEGAGLALYGTGSGESFGRVIERRNVPVGLSLNVFPDGESPGLARPTYRRRVPSIFAAASVEALAAPEAFDREAFDRRVRFLGLLVRGFALDPDAIAFRAVEAEGEGVRSAGKPWLGTIPDYADAPIPGLLLDGVAPGGPADQAGLKGGDIIVHLAGVEVTGIQDYADAIELLEIGEATKVIWVRDGKRSEGSITPGARK